MASKKDRFFAALGLVSANFQVLEKYVEFLVWALIGDQEAGQILTSQMSFDRICSALSALFRYRVQDSNLIQEMDDIIKKAAQAEERRNAVVHSSWLGVENPDSSIIRFKITSRRKRGLEHQYEHMDPSDLREIALFIKEVAEELQTFILKVQEQGIINLPSLQIRTPHWKSRRAGEFHR